MTMFVNRREEIKKLEQWDGDVALIFGRRRVGKTRLIKEFIKGKKALYLLCADKGSDYNLRNFSQMISEKYDTPGLRFDSFKEMFQFLVKQETEFICIDEFGYLVKSGIVPEFQEIIDEILNQKLLLSGSNVSTMKSEITGYDSPTYGRMDLVKKINPLNFKDILEWFPNIDVEDAVKLYAVTGGVPRYLEFFRGEDVDEEIREKMFDPDLMLSRDTKLLLQEEMPEPTRYYLILEAIARGKNSLTEISNYSKIERNQLPYYLNNLRDLGFVKHEKPLLAKKRGIYKITDNYMRFWFRFISPFYEEIDSENLRNAKKNFDKEFNMYLGYIFEDICREIIRDTEMIDYTQMRRWWWKDKEIDIAAINEDSKEVFLGECKWKEQVDAEMIETKIKEKASHLRWNNKDRKENYMVFAKSFLKKSETSKCFDLEDLNMVLSNKKR
ncbi:MAG: ATP-binding protein [Thermoplasmatota archaeon]